MNSANLKILEIMIEKWEGGEIIDTQFLIRELIKAFRDSVVARRVDDVIG